MRTCFRTIAVLVCAVAFIVGAGPSLASDKRFVAIGTGGPTGVYFSAGNAICLMVHRGAAEGRKSGRQHGLRCSAPSTDGSIYNIEQVMDGELDFGVVQSDWHYHAYKGSSKWQDKGPQRDLRALFSLHSEPFHMVVRSRAQVSTFKDLKGKVVNLGNVGSGTRGTMEALLKAHGVGPDFFAEAEALTSTEQARALCAGSIDAFGYAVGVPNAGVAVAIDGCSAHLINLDGAAEKAMVASNPHYVDAVIKKGAYKTVTEDVKTFGVTATVVSSAAVSDDVVYEVVRAVFENLEDFKKLHPSFANLSAPVMIRGGLTAPLHPGALRYYREKGWM